MSYEYFASSLPAMRFGEKPPMEPGELLASACGVLSGEDFAALSAVFSGAESGHPFVAAWRDCETQLRNAVARRRAARRASSSPSGAPSDAASRFERPHGGWCAAIESGVAAAWQEPDPLARHRALARLRWDVASELAGPDAFSPSAVLAWAVKLLVARDLAAVDGEAGLAKLDAAATAAAAGEKRG